MAAINTTPRIVLAKVGLDGHDRGIKVVARGLRDEGFHVIYAGLWQSPEAVVRAVADEDARWLGLSLLSGAHMTLVPRVLESMKEAGLAGVGILVGGIIPDDDARQLMELGVKRVFGPGTELKEIAEYIRGQEQSSDRRPSASVRESDRQALSRLLTEAARGAIESPCTIPGGRGSVRAGFVAGSDGASPSQDHEKPLRSAIPGGPATLAAAGGGQLPAAPPKESTEGAAALEPRRKSLVIAITGSGGVGKSTLIGKLIEVIRGAGRSVAVLACDPQSPLTGGALLGDRIRMPSRPDDNDVFIRSLATPGGRSGVAPNVELMVELFARFGFDFVIVETVGAGQGDTAIGEIADVVIVLVQPETGDELQWEKAGQLEIADLVVVHKSDLPTAGHTLAQLHGLLNLPGCRAVPVLAVSSNKGLGVEEVWAAVEACRPRRRALTS